MHSQRLSFRRPVVADAEAYLAEKRAEWDVYKAQVHEWEIDEYMERF